MNRKHRAAIGAALKEAWQRPEMRERRAASLAAAWTPERRAKQSATLKAALARKKARA